MIIEITNKFTYGIYYFIKLIISIDYKMVYDIFEKFLDNLNDFSSNILTIEVALFSVIFIFLPIIIDNKSKEYYLGFKVSDWLFKSGKKIKNNINDSTITWIVEFVLFAFSYIFSIFNCSTFQLIIFFIFLIYIFFKVIYYLNAVSTNNYKKDIEKYFNDTVLRNPNELINIIIKNKQQTDIETLEFVVKNYNKSFEKIFDFMYINIVNSGSQILIGQMFEIIKNNRKQMDIEIYSADLGRYIEQNINMYNINKVFEIADYYIESSFYNVLNNNISINRYDDIFFSIYCAISNAIGIDKNQRKRLFGDLLQKFDWEIIGASNLDDNQKEIRSRLIFDFLKNLIMKKDYKEAEIIIEFLNDDRDINDYKRNIDIFSVLLIYLFYSIELESEQYISNIEKGNIKKIYAVVLEHFNICEITLLTQDELYKAIENLFNNWERINIDDYKRQDIKNYISDGAVRISRIAFFVIYNIELKRNGYEIHWEEYLKYVDKSDINEGTITQTKEFLKFVKYKFDD